MDREMGCSSVSITVAKDCQGSTARHFSVQSCIQILGPVIINQWCSLVILFSIITSLILLVMMMHPRKPSYRWNSNPFLAANYMVGCRLVVEDGTDVVLFNASNEISLQFKSQHHHYLQSWSSAKKHCSSSSPNQSSENNSKNNFVRIFAQFFAQLFQQTFTKEKNMETLSCSKQLYTSVTARFI